jgi:hypothetical protein
MPSAFQSISWHSFWYNIVSELRCK